MPTNTSSTPDLVVLLFCMHLALSVRSPPGRLGWTLISVLEARLPLASTEPAAAGRDGSAAGPRGSRCQGPLPAAEVTDGMSRRVLMSADERCPARRAGWRRSRR